MNSIIITGVSGFVGRNLAKYLAANTSKEIIGFSRTDPQIPEVNHLPIDLTNSKNLPTEFKDASVIHCAALTEDGRGENFYKVNVLGTQNALKINPDGKFIHLSSSSIYDLSKPSHFVEENDFQLNHYSFFNDYSRTKAISENIILNQPAVQRTKPVISLRPHGIYGEDDTTLLPRILKRIRNNKISLPNSGNVYHSLTNIKNLLHAIELFLTKDYPETEAFNIADESPTTIQNAIRKINPDVKFRNISLGLALQASKYLNQVSPYEVRQIGMERTYSLNKAKKEGYKPTQFEIDWSVTNNHR